MNEPHRTARALDARRDRATINVAAIVAAIAFLFALPLIARAQDREHDTYRERPREGSLPRDVARSLADTWNAPKTKRARGTFTLAANDTVHGDLGVLDGPVTIAGVVTGHLIGINADVTLESTAHIGGDVTVTGGILEGRARGDVVGEIRVWRARMRFHEDQEQIVPDVDRTEFARDDWQRWQRWRGHDESQGAWGDLFMTSAHTYNRVEGLPLLLGPRLRTRHGPTSVNVEAYGIFRTGDDLSWVQANLGHHLKAEVREGRRTGVSFGGVAYDEVAPVERWTLTDNEIGLASVLFTHDFRDYYQRHGGNIFGSIYGPVGTSISASFGEERWGSRAARNPWSLFNDKEPWRINPLADEGKLHLATLKAEIDTRNNREHPRSGWFISSEYERGTGHLTKVAPTLPGIRNTVPGEITYSRLMLDARRYNRLAPNTQLNLRVVAGGSLEGDPLPMQRRFSVSGADALPGYDFRSKFNDHDVGTCATGDDAAYMALGRPALCDRMVLVQAEWKSDFHLGLFGDTDWFDHDVSTDGTWVVFMDSGRGWLVGTDDGKLRYSKDALPGVSTWRTDIGGGFDFGGFGVYIAQAISEGGLKPNVFIRLGRRF